MSTKKEGSTGHKTYRIWRTPSLALLGVFSIVSITAVVLFLILSAWGESTVIVVFFAFVWVVFAIAIFSSRREIFGTLILDRDGIFFPETSKKREFVPYIRYSHVYLGYYLHGFAGFAKTYIVLSQRFIPAGQLAQVNELAQTTDVVKLQFSKRKYQILHEMLPLKQRIMLERVCDGLVDVDS